MAMTVFVRVMVFVFGVLSEIVRMAVVTISSRIRR
jgi:hypothetical protein